MIWGWRQGQPHSTALQFSTVNLQHSTLQGIALHVTQRVEWFARRR